MRIGDSLTGERVRVRDYRRSDLEFVTGMWFDPENGAYLSDPDRDHVDAVYQKALDRMEDSPDGYYLVVELAGSGERAGTCCMFPDEAGKVYDIGYCIHKSHWRQGLGRETVSLLLHWLRERGAQTVTAEAAAENAASRALLDGLGFEVQRKSRFKKYRMDVEFESVVYAKTLAPHTKGKDDAAMDMLELIAKRTSYRGRYLPQPVPREDLRKIMEAGLAAPSGCNKQTTSLIAVDGPEVLARLKAAIDPPVASTAPAAICVLTRKIFAYRDRCYQVQDYSAAIENMLLAIKALGYESCWYEGHITDLDRIDLKMAAVLGVPEDYSLVCYLPVGKAAQEPRPSPPKKTFEERAWFNGFGGQETGEGSGE